MTRRLFRLGGCSLIIAAAVVLVNETRSLRSPAYQLANASFSHGIDLSAAARVIEIAVQEPLNPLRNETVLLRLQNRTGGDLNLSRVRAASRGCLKFSAEKLTIPADGTQMLRVEVALGDRNGMHRFAIELGSDELGTWRIELLARALPVLRVSDPVLIA